MDVIQTAGQILQPQNDRSCDCIFCKASGVIPGSSAGTEWCLCLASLFCFTEEILIGCAGTDRETSNAADQRRRRPHTLTDTQAHCSLPQNHKQRLVIYLSLSHQDTRLPRTHTTSGGSRAEGAGRADLQPRRL